MDTDDTWDAARRRWLGSVVVVPLGWVGLPSRVALAAPTPACEEGGATTPPQMAGPFFKPRSPRRKSLADPADAAPRLTLSGQVLSPRCVPLANALLDFWHCDTAGEYDNAGFRYRGHQFTDAEGRYALETIFPGEYPQRVRHIHVRVQAANGPVLTTQLYFPGEPGNAEDFLFRPDLMMALREAAGTRQGKFDFVVRTA